MTATATVPAVPAVPAAVPTAPSLGASIADSARRLVVAVRANAARVARYVGSKLGIPPGTVLPLALVVLVLIAIVLTPVRVNEFETAGSRIQ